MKNIFITLFLISIVFTQTKNVSAAKEVMDFETERATGVSAAANEISAEAEETFTQKWFAEQKDDALANRKKHKRASDTAKLSKAWASGGFQGNPTFPTNPGRYFDNIETEGIRIGLSEMTKNGGNLYSESTEESIIYDFRREQLPINDRIPFTLGKTIQDNNCSDEALSARARKIVGNNADVNLYNSKKKELSDQLCSKDAKTDKEAQKKNLECFAGDFMCGGWGAWIDLVNGQNEYNISTQRQIAIEQEAADKKQLATDELLQGGGSIGIKKCVKYSETKVTEDGIADCEEYEVQTPGYVVTSLTNKGIAAPITAGEDSYGATDFTPETEKGVEETIEDIFDGLLDEDLEEDTGLVGNTSYTLTDGEINTTNQTSFNIDNNVELDKTKLLEKLTEATETINRIYTVNASFIAYLENTVARLDGLNSCYDSLYTINPNFSRIGEIPGNKAWVSSKKTDIQKTIEIRTKNSDEYYAGKTIIASIKSTISNSNSTDIIKEAMSQYLVSLGNGVIPHQGQEKIIQADFYGRQREMNYHLSTKEVECVGMQSQAYNEISMYNNW